MIRMGCAPPGSAAAHRELAQGGRPKLAAAAQQDLQAGNLGRRGLLLVLRAARLQAPQQRHRGLLQLERGRNDRCYIRPCV